MGNRTALTSCQHEIANHDPRRPTSSFDPIIIRLLNRHAVDPLEQRAATHDDGERHDDEPDKSSDPAARDPQNGHGEGRLAPEGGEDGEEAGCLSK